MSTTQQPGRGAAAPSGRTTRIPRILHRIAEIVAECRYAQQRMATIRMAPDGYLADPDAAPDTYAEFLFRTSMPLEHEPSAWQRSAGRA
jgi:hypothetical protein